MIIQVDVNELRSIALLSKDAAEKMDESNRIIGSVVSKHDWKCPEREKIDSSLETIKSNSRILNSALEDFSTSIIGLANDFTDIINDQLRDEAGYEDDVVSIVSELMGNGITTVASGGSCINSIATSLETTSMVDANISSLHGASHGINIVDFSLFDD